MSERKIWLPEDVFEKVSKKEWILFGALVSFFIIYAFPKLVEHLYYVDDFSRVISNGLGWNTSGRFGGTIIIALLEGSPMLGDTQPLFPIIGLISLAGALTCFYRKYLLEYPLQFVIPALAVVICSPFLLENLSYIYDTVTMLIALSLVIVAYCRREKNNKSSLRWQVGILFFAYLTYQPCMGALFVLILLRSFFEILEGESLKNILYSEKNIIKAVAYASFLYMFVVLLALLRHNGFVMGHFQSHGNYFVSVLNNLYLFIAGLEYLLESIPFQICIMVFVILYYLFLWVKANRERADKYRRLVYAIFCLLGAIIVSFLGLAMLPSVFLVARLYISLTICYFFFSFCWMKLSMQKKWCYYLIVPVLYGSLVLSYTYFNTLYADEQQVVYIARSIANDIESNEQFDKLDKVAFIGERPRTKEQQYVEKRFPVVKMLIPPYLSGNWTWSAHVISHYAVRDYSIADSNKIPKDYVSSNSINRIIYTLYKYGDTIVVKF